MTNFIVLPIAEVDKLFPVDPETKSRTRLSRDGHAICPIPLEGDQEFILPLEVLDDPAHAETLKMLAGEAFDATAIDALPIDQKPTIIDVRDAIDLKAPDRIRQVSEAELKQPALETAEVEPRPYPSWTLDEATTNWIAPVPMPSEGRWRWDEETLAWVEILPPAPVDPEEEPA